MKNYEKRYLQQSKKHYDERMTNTAKQMKRKSKKDTSPFGIHSGPKWGTPEHAAARAEFFAEIEANNLAKYGRKFIPAMPIISDEEFNRLQDLSRRIR